MTDKVTPPLDLEAAKRLVEAATPGPWTPYFSVHGDPYVAQEGRPKFGVIVSTAPDDYGRADAEFIAAARTLVPALIAEVERLRAVLAESIPRAEAYELLRYRSPSDRPAALPDEARQ